MAAELRGARHPQKPQQKQQGVALIEVMVSLVIFLVGVLSVVGLQARAIQFSVQAEDRSRAALLANEMVSLLWHQQSSAPTDAQLAGWKQQVSQALPGSSATVRSDAGLVTVTIQWRSVGTGTDPGGAHRYVTQVALP